MILYGEWDVLVVVADDKVGGIDERLLGGVEIDEEVSSSENLVNVDMPLEVVESAGEAYSAC